MIFRRIRPRATQRERVLRLIASNEARDRARGGLRQRQDTERAWFARMGTFWQPSDPEFFAVEHRPATADELRTLEQIHAIEAEYAAYAELALAELTRQTPRRRA